MAAYTRKQYSGAARNTTTTTLLTNVGTTVDITATTGWPSIAGIPFYVVISPSSIYEEKCLATISGSTLTLVRAQDDTTASEHQIGSVIYPVFTANDADEANELVSKLTTKGDLLVTDGTNLLRLGVGTEGYFLKASSSASAGVEWASIPTINSLNDIGDVIINDVEEGDFLVYKNSASAWINETFHFITVSDTEPTDEIRVGDLWYNSSELELYTYYSGSWIQVTLTPEFPKIEELDNVYISTANTGDVLAFDGLDWYNDTVSNLFGSHIIALSGDVSGSVMFDGSASVNISTTLQPNSIALGVDTTGNYVATLTAGTGITLANNSGEGASPTVTVDTAVIQARVTNVTDTEIGYLDGVTSAIQTQIDSKQPTFTGYDYEIHVSQVDGNDTTGNGDLLTPVASITKALTLVTSQRKTVIIHPGTYTESPSITTQYTTLTGPGLIGGNIVISGTVSTNTGCTISGIKMTNLTVSTPTAQGNVNILNCEVSGTFTKSSNADYTVARLCDFGAVSITGAGLVAIFGGNPNFVTVNNASANVIVKSAVTVAPVLTAGTLSLVDSIVVAASTNAVTSSASSVITLANSQFLTSNLSGVAPVVLNGFYSILNCVYDKPNSTLVATSGTGGSTNSVDYFQYINADKFITQGGTSTQVVKGDGSLGSVALGTETTGNYMSDLTQGTGITITHTPGEGSNATIAIGQAVSTSSSVTFANVTATGTVTLAADPSLALEAATKQYVDNAASGINFHASVVAATSGNLAGTYNNGTAGVGATLTKATNGSIGTIDGASIVVGSRILVKSQTDSKQNGIYTITAVGSASAPWVVTRATDADNSASGEMASGDFCFVMGGNTNAGYGFINNSPTNPIVIGTDNVTYTAFNAAQVVVAGNGIAYSGTSLNIGTADSSRIVVSTDDIDLATVSVSNSFQDNNSASMIFTGVEVDSYGRVTGKTAATHRLASTTAPGIIQYDGNYFEYSDATFSIKANSIELGTDTTGNYMLNVSAGTGIAISHTQGEGSTASVSTTGVQSLSAKAGNYTLAIGDAAETIIIMDSSSANDLTVPSASAVSFTTGTSITIVQRGTGKTRILAGAGVTLLATPGVYLRARYSSCTLVKTENANEWFVIGDLAAS